MFGWFKRKTKEKGEAAAAERTQPEAVAPAASVATPVPQAASVFATPPADVPPSESAFAPRRIGSRPPSARIRILHKPALGGQSIEILHNRRKRAAEIVRIQGGGRRIVARLGESGRTYAYTRSPDGLFRLERAPAASAARILPTAH